VIPANYIEPSATTPDTSPNGSSPPSPSAWLSASVSVFPGSRDARPIGTAPVGAVLEAIRTGTYGERIEGLRYLRSIVSGPMYVRLKGRLDAVTFAGTFAPTRARAHLVQHTGLVHGDLDHLPDVEAVKRQLCAAPYTAYAFVSPSGDGLKLGVLTGPVADAVAYTHAWQTVAAHYHREYGVTWDSSGKDVCRLCYLSADPDLFLRPDPLLFPVPALPPALPPVATPLPRHPVPQKCAADAAGRALQVATGMIFASTLGNRHHTRTRAAYLLGGYVAGGLLAEDQAMQALEAAVERNTETLEASLKTIHQCFEAGKERPIAQASLAQWRMTSWRRHARPAVVGKPSTVSAVSLKPAGVPAVVMKPIAIAVLEGRLCHCAH
jgi:hypothetical protein